MLPLGLEISIRPVGSSGRVWSMGVPANSGALARQATMARARTRGEWRIANLRGAGGASAEAALGEFERSEEHTSELQSLMRISYAVFCLKKKKNRKENIAQETSKK